MAIKQSIGFGIEFVGDGLSTSIIVTLATGAVVYQFPLVRSSDQASTKFDATTLVVSSLQNLVSSDGQVVTATVGLLGASVTFSWPIAIPNGSKVLVYGDMVF